MHNRNPIMESWRLRRAGTGGGGGHKSRNAPRGGQRNVQAHYLAEYMDEVDEAVSETENKNDDHEEDGMTFIVRRPAILAKGGLLFFVMVQWAVELFNNAQLMKKDSVTIVGAGNMGTALACVIAQTGRMVKIWNYEGDPEPLTHIASLRENKKYLPGITIPEAVIAQGDLGRALEGSRLVILALPSSVIMSTFRRAEQYLTRSMIIIDVSKGIEDGHFNQSKKSAQKVTFHERLWNDRVMLSGPAVASELARGAFTVMEAVSQSARNVRQACAVLSQGNLRLIPTTDVRGVKICGALKNCYAILLGMLDAENVSLNTKAYLVTAIVAEMARVVQWAGGKKTTVMGIAGLGDLIGTGLSPVSRNRRFGEYLWCYRDRGRAEREVGQIIEGVHALTALQRLLKGRFKQAPFLALTHRLLNDPNACDSVLSASIKII